MDDPLRTAPARCNRGLLTSVRKRRLAKAHTNILHSESHRWGETHKGEIRVERVGGLFTNRHQVLLIGGRDRTALVDSVERQLAIVRTALTRPGAGRIDVRGALCFPNPDGLPIFGQLTVREIVIDGPKPV